MFDQIEAFGAKNEDFDQTYLHKGLGSKTQNVEELTLDLMFHNNFWAFWSKSFRKQNSKLRIPSKLDRNQSKLTLWLKSRLWSWLSYWWWL